MKCILNIIFILEVLSGCTAHSGPVQPVEVKIPVAVSCIAYELPEPQWNMPRLSRDTTASEKLRSILADNELQRGYIGELKAELAACK